MHSQLSKTVWQKEKSLTWALSIKVVSKTNEVPKEAHPHHNGLKAWQILPSLRRLQKGVIASAKGWCSLPSPPSLALFMLKLLTQRHINLTPTGVVGRFVSPSYSFDYQLERLSNYSDHGACLDLIIQHRS